MDQLKEKSQGSVDSFQIQMETGKDFLVLEEEKSNQDVKDTHIAEKNRTTMHYDSVDNTIISQNIREEMATETEENLNSNEQDTSQDPSKTEAVESKAGHSLAIVHFHPSIVKSLDDLELKLCAGQQCECGGLGSTFHCPMCPYSEGFKDQKTAEEHILQTHWSRRTEIYKDILLLTCLCVDISSPHIHCPICGSMLLSGQGEEEHLISCISSQTLQSDVNKGDINADNTNISASAVKTAAAFGSAKGIGIEKFKRHHTVVSNEQDITLSPCTECCRGKKYHCPICPVSLFRPQKEAAVQTHMETHHWKHRMTYKDFIILKCTSTCKGQINGLPLESHWHCPLCPVKATSKQAMNSHFGAHNRGTNLVRRSNAEWANLLGPEAAKVLFSNKAEEILRGEEEVELEMEEGGSEKENGDGKKGRKSSGATVNDIQQPNVFQTVVGLLTQEMMEAIPGELSGFFSKVQEKETIQYTTSNEWCLLQGDWKSMSRVYRKLKTYLDQTTFDDCGLNEMDDELLSRNDGLEKIEESPKDEARAKFFTKELVKDEELFQFRQVAASNDTRLKLPQTEKGSEMAPTTDSDLHTVENKNPKSLVGNQETANSKQNKTCNDGLENQVAVLSSNAPDVKEPVVSEGISNESVSSIKTIGESKEEIRSRVPSVTALLDDKTLKNDTPIKRGRGRPRKVIPEKDLSQKMETSGEAHLPEKTDDTKGPNTNAESSTSLIDARQDSKTKTGRVKGRPRKNETSSKPMLEVPTETKEGKRLRKPSKRFIESQELKKYFRDQMPETNNDEDNSEKELSTEDKILEPPPKRHIVKPDITISISEDTGELLSVAVNDTENDPSSKVIDVEAGVESNIGHIDGPENLGSNAKLQGLLLARKPKVIACPACLRLFKDKHRLYQHIFRSNCVNNKISQDKYFRMPPKLDSLIKEVNQKVTSTKCPRCNKSFREVFIAKMHYASQTCAKTPEEKYDGLVLNTTTEAFHCRHCDFHSKNVHRVMLHEQRKHHEKTEPCPICNKMFGSVTVLKEHIKSAHAIGNNRSVCDICGASVASKNLKQHYKVVHDPTYVRPKRDQNKIYECPQCEDFITTSYAHFFRHKVKAHRKADKKCPFCEQTFALTGQLSRHVKTVHEGLQSEQGSCPQCGKTMSKKNIMAHIRMVHEKIRNYACKVCGRTFLTKFNLKSHEQTHVPSNQRDTKFLCAFCGKGFLNKTHYTDHLNTHTGARPYVCNICHKTFRCCPGLAKHKELHKNIDLSCRTCNLHFASRKALRIHHNQVHSTSMFRCVCDAEYSNEETLINHQATCGQWQQANPAENQEIHQMAIVNAQPGTYLVYEGEEGEKTVMVIQSVDELEYKDAAENILDGNASVVLKRNENKISEVAGGVEIANSVGGSIAMTESEMVSFSVSEVVDFDNKINADRNNSTGDSGGNDIGASALEIEKHIGNTSQRDEAQNSYQCGNCTKLFSNLEDVKSHIQTEHAPPDTGDLELALQTA